MSWSLVADIGGTNARFAAIQDGMISAKRTFATKGEMGLLDALSLYLEQFEHSPDRVVLAAAGLIHKGCVKLTNARHEISIDKVSQVSGAPDVRFINDFEAAAWALASVAQNDVRTVHGDAELTDGNRLVIGPGTGLGVGMLIHAAGSYHAVPGEGGHVAIGPANSEEATIFSAFRTLWPDPGFGPDGWHFEAEAMLSGTGLPYLHDAVCLSAGLEAPGLDGAEIMKAAQENDPLALQTVGFFSRNLGRVAGDLALAISATGGVFIVGGVISANPWLLNKDFVDGFIQGGRFTDARKRLSVYHYQNTEFGLIGASNALGQTG